VTKYLFSYEILLTLAPRNNAARYNLDPLVKRFMGQVVEVEDSTKMPIFGDSPTLLNLGGLGKCNSTTWCDLTRLRGFEGYVNRKSFKINPSA
jgi:hypothetical protein